MGKRYKNYEYGQPEVTKHRAIRGWCREEKRDESQHEHRGENAGGPWVGDKEAALGPSDGDHDTGGDQDKNPSEQVPDLFGCHGSDSDTTDAATDQGGNECSKERRQAYRPDTRGECSEAQETLANTGEPGGSAEKHANKAALAGDQEGTRPGRKPAGGSTPQGLNESHRRRLRIRGDLYAVGLVEQHEHAEYRKRDGHPKRELRVVAIRPAELASRHNAEEGHDSKPPGTDVPQHA